MTREQILTEALTEILRMAEDHPLKNEDISLEVMDGRFDLCEETGGDESFVSEIVGRARKALQK